MEMTRKSDTMSNVKLYSSVAIDSVSLPGLAQSADGTGQRPLRTNNTCWREKLTNSGRLVVIASNIGIDDVGNRHGHDDDGAEPPPPFQILHPVDEPVEKEEKRIFDGKNGDPEQRHAGVGVEIGSSVYLGKLGRDLHSHSLNPRKRVHVVEAADKDARACDAGQHGDE